MKLIEFRNVSKTYEGGFIVLNDINLSIKAGEFISIVGASGAGKSTLLKMIYADEEPTSGTIFFGNRDISTIKKKTLPFYRRNFGTVFQDAKLLEYKTIFENVAYALEVQGAGDEQIKKEVPKLLEIVGLSNQTNKYPNQISGGEAQRASLARALIHRPRVLIADEPTGNLDPNSTWEMTKLLLKINELGTTIILATHDEAVVNNIYKRVVVIGNGSIVSDNLRGKYSTY